MVKLSVDKMLWKAKAHANNRDLMFLDSLMNRSSSFFSDNRAKQGLENL